MDMQHLLIIVYRNCLIIYLYMNANPLKWIILYDVVFNCMDYVTITHPSETIPSATSHTNTNSKAAVSNQRRLWPGKCSHVL